MAGLGGYDAESLAGLTVPLVIVSGFYVAIASADPQPEITVLRT